MQAAGELVVVMEAGREPRDRLLASGQLFNRVHVGQQDFIHAGKGLLRRRVRYSKHLGLGVV